MSDDVMQEPIGPIAAARLAELEAENERLREALEPFAANIRGHTPEAENFKQVINKMCELAGSGNMLTTIQAFATACINARAALGGKNE